MTEEIIKINVPDGMEIDREKSTLTNIVFKKKEPIRSRSWEEFCENNPRCVGEFDIDPHSEVQQFILGDMIRDPKRDRNLIATREQAEAFRALMQLVRIRQEWVGDWKPNWMNDDTKFAICFIHGNVEVKGYWNISRVLSFPTEIMAQYFLDCFRDLILTAKSLI